jgi:hypothetical protein
MILFLFLGFNYEIKVILKESHLLFFKPNRIISLLLVKNFAQPLYLSNYLIRIKQKFLKGTVSDFIPMDIAH